MHRFWRGIAESKIGKVAVVLAEDAGIAICMMLAISIVDYAAHAMKIDTHKLVDGYTFADLFRWFHAANIVTCLGFGLFHLVQVLRRH